MEIRRMWWLVALLLGGAVLAARAPAHAGAGTGLDALCGAVTVAQAETGASRTPGGDSAHASAWVPRWDTRAKALFVALLLLSYGLAVVLGWVVESFWAGNADVAWRFGLSAGLALFTLLMRFWFEQAAHAPMPANWVYVLAGLLALMAAATYLKYSAPQPLRPR